MSSLADITGQSDLVIRGTINDLYTSPRNDSGFEAAFITVSIGEVLKGEPASDEAGTAQVEIGHGYGLDGLRSSLPVHDHLWFLILGENGHTYYTTDYEQVSVLRDIGGVVEVIMPDWIARAYSRRHFPVPLDGTSFDELVDRVRQLVEGSSDALRAYTRWSPSGETDPNRFDAC